MQSTRWAPFIWSTAVVAATLAAAKMTAALAALPNISMVFLMAVLFSAVTFGLWPAIYASGLSFLAYNFFFIEPLYSFQIAAPHELLALVVFLIVAVVTSALAGRVRDQALLANERAQAMRRLYEQAVTARDSAETERVRNVLLASISHDFRTPLASILGSATSLIDYRDRLNSAAQSDLLTQIKSEAERLDLMVRNLLAMMRIDAGALELRRDWVDLREVAERVASAVRRRGAAISVELHLPGALPMIQADAVLVEQALGNVVGNVSQHTPEGTRVVIEADQREGEVVLCVTDDGPGIPAQLLPRVFEKFTTYGKADGTGLELAIAKGVVQAHGGSVTAQSPVAAGRGTRVVMTFPREQPR